MRKVGKNKILKKPGPIEAEMREMKYKLIYSLAGLFLGLSCLTGGIFLFLNGIEGSTNWVAKILGSESSITGAAPGSILFIVGLFIILITRYKIWFSYKDAKRDIEIK